MSQRIQNELHGLTKRHRDSQLDQSYKLGLWVTEHNELPYQKILFEARGGVGRLPKCCRRKNK